METGTGAVGNGAAGTGNQTPPAGTPAQTGAATPPAPATGAGAPPSSPFYSGFQDAEVKGYAEMKGFKDPESVVRSYRDLEKLRGVPEERLLKLPEKLDDAEAMAAVFTRLGRPETPEGYELPVIREGQPEDTNPFLQKTFHEAGLNKQQATKLATALGERAKTVAEAHQQKLAEIQAEKEMNLKNEWGAAYQQNMGQVAKIAEAMGITKEQMLVMEDAIGVDTLAKGIYNLVGKFGIKLGEDDPSAGGNGGHFALSPAAAKARIEYLKADAEWSQNYLNGKPENVAEMNRLQQLAFPTPTYQAP